ncbi:MAG TPA: dihydrodipicolinate synthase family protein [Candidatus Dormibacteraeota bacterium]|nr:dihydrodipicolinate synthase family protein [Candidatus Dormibacteraeota bacterium]
MTVRGVCPVLAVPFLENGDIDLDGFKNMTRHVLGTGVTAVMLFGFASEFYKLTDEERTQLRQALLQETRGHDDVTAIISITDHATEVAVSKAREAVAGGASALNILPPYLLGPSRGAIIDHLAAILNAVDAPVIIQYAPALTGTNLDAPSLRGLAAAHSNLRMVKVESTPPGRLIADLAEGDPPLPALVGYAGVQLPDALRRGAVGVQPGCSFTEVYVALWRAWEAGEHDQALDLHRRMLPYISYWMQHVELIIQAEKTILARRGIVASDRCRAPGWPLDREERAMIDYFLEEFESLLV